MRADALILPGKTVHFKEDDPPPVSEEDGQAAATFDLSVLAPTAEGRDFDEAAIQAQFRRLPQHMRIRFLHIVLDACLPGDIATMARTLERHLRSTRDVVSHLPDDVCLRIFERLEVKEVRVRICLAICAQKSLLSLSFVTLPTPSFYAAVKCPKNGATSPPGRNSGVHTRLP